MPRRKLQESLQPQTSVSLSFSPYNGASLTYPFAAPAPPLVTSHSSTAFMTPTWRNTAIATALALVIYNTFPSPPARATSPSTDPEYATRTAQSLPWFSRVLAQLTPDAKVWTERNEKHLQMTREAAEDRLLFQEAERPRIHRLRNPGCVFSASVYGLGC
jgi:hypothetical protein